MRSEGNPLDLNNFPEDNNYIRDGKQIIVDDNNSTVSSFRKKKSGIKEGKEESAGKVYECRFCSLKFCKSQALGGHMNRHRQERETETLNRARQLVFSNDNIAAAQPPSHLGCCHSMTPGSYHSTGGGDPTLPPLRYPTRIFPTSSSSNNILPHHHHPHPSPPPPPPPPPHQPYLYTSPPSRPPSSYYPAPHDYYIGHVFGNNTNSSQSQCSHQNVNFGSTSFDSNNYTCIGAPVGFSGGGEGGGGGGGDVSLQGNQQRLDVPSSINRFQADGF